MSSILVTGANGFVGQHLVNILKQDGHEVIGTGTQPAAKGELGTLLDSYVPCDLSQPAEVARLPLDTVDAVINLAGLAAVGRSFDEPDKYMTINVAMLSILGDRVRHLGRHDLRIVAVSTGAVYAPDQPLPLNEDSRTSTSSSPYAASKLAMEQVGLQLRADGFDCVIARPFNHIGPGQEAGFLLPDLYEKLRITEKEVRVGNLETKRDYTDVRDVARAYIALATASSLSHDIYNVCSGHAVAGTEILRRLAEACGKQGVQTVVDPDLFRPSDTPEIFGDSSRLRSETGWRPAIALERTVSDFVKSKQ